MTDISVAPIPSLAAKMVDLRDSVAVLNGAKSGLGVGEPQMETVERMKAAGRLIGYFEALGYSVREVTDLGRVRSMIEDADKPYLSSFGNPGFNDFSEGNCLWLIIADGEVPAYMGCARLEEVGDEPIERYWSRVFVRHHGEGGSFQSVGGNIERFLTGRLAYFGDLFVEKQHRGSRVGLQAFLALAHLSVSLKWNPDWTYCFIREQHILRGSAALYGFTRQVPNPIKWVSKPPLPRTESDWLVALPRQDLLSSVQRVVGTVCSSIGK